MTTKRLFRGASIALALSTAVAGAGACTGGGDDDAVTTAWPSEEDPGMPFYARVELLPPYIFNDGTWAAIVFYRDPSCVPDGFNLISVFDAPAAFSCPHTVHGTSTWDGEVNNGAPTHVEIIGDGAVPVWFVPWTAVEDQARADGVLTVADLEQIDGLLVGHADQYTEDLRPHPVPAIGGGGSADPGMIVAASGQLDDGGQFRLQISWADDQVEAIEIALP